ncbi:uncharacterized protein LOC112594470 [Melanaphis sacchari]|uniref:uncharacterized protein LOC112594470 n=1 Tax=Melanaphis sacchari TaxID=742174 RepID=UPI000DC13904|nr:uncharacterized protein LOC112594470 [Melanaphis sacchari]
MKVKIAAILILRIILIDGFLEDGVTNENKPHTDEYDITTIYKTTAVHNVEEEDNQKPINNSERIYYDVKIHLRTNAIGMPINFNGFILSSDKKSLELIADTKYLTTLNNIFTRNQIEYNPDEWTISELSMSNGAEPPKKFNYDLLLWKANTNEESFEIKWKQINSIKMCISISYLLEDESKCTLSMAFQVDAVLGGYVDDLVVGQTAPELGQVVAGTVHVHLVGDDQLRPVEHRGREASDLVPEHVHVRPRLGRGQVDDQQQRCAPLHVP